MSESLRAERDEARDLARALWSALTEIADDYGQIANQDEQLDPDVCLPYWLTSITGAPDTWQRDGETPGA